MPYPTKRLAVLALVGKEEVTYGTPVALTPSTDGLELQYASRDVGAPVDLAYDYDGSLGPSVTVFGPNIRTAQSGRSAKGSLPFRFRGAGVAYSASALPSSHRIFKMAGFDATGSFTAGTEKYTYALTPGGNIPTSLTLNCYSAAELWAIAGALSDLKLDAPGAAPPIWTADIMGIANALPTDGSAPATTYPNTTVAPATATAIALTIGGFTTNAVCYNSAFALGRKLNPRVAQTAAGGHLGFVPDDIAPTMTVEIERTALVGSPFNTSSGLDAYSLRETGQTFVAGLKYGTVQYNRQTINFPTAQVVTVVPSNQGSVATWKLTIAGANSTPSTLDCVNIVAD